MIELVLASRNRKKIAEMSALLSGTVKEEIRILSLDDVGYTGDIEENGATFEENALIKAREASRFSGLTSVADDSGLMVDALNGAPGVYSARFAGEHGNDAANNEKLLSLLENVPDEQRTARFVTVIACVLPHYDKPLIAHGSVEGRILRAPRGNSGFGYDPLFYYEPYGKTFAELSAEEKNAVSHRGNALRALSQWLKARKV